MPSVLSGVPSYPVKAGFLYKELNHNTSVLTDGTGWRVPVDAQPRSLGNVLSGGSLDQIGPQNVVQPIP